MRPAGWPPMDMSKKTCGIATVFFGRGGFFAIVCAWALSAPSVARAGHLWLLAWLQRLACACAPAEPGLAACLFFAQRGSRGAIFCSAQRDGVAVVVAGTLLLAIGLAMVIFSGWRQSTSLGAHESGFRLLADRNQSPVLQSTARGRLWTSRFGD